MNGSHISAPAVMTDPDSLNRRDVPPGAKKTPVTQLTPGSARLPPSPQRANASFPRSITSTQLHIRTKYSDPARAIHCTDMQRSFLGVVRFSASRARAQRSGRPAGQGLSFSFPLPPSPHPGGVVQDAGVHRELTRPPHGAAARYPEPIPTTGPAHPRAKGSEWRCWRMRRRSSGPDPPAQASLTPPPPVTVPTQTRGLISALSARGRRAPISLRARIRRRHIPCRPSPSAPPRPA